MHPVLQGQPNHPRPICRSRQHYGRRPPPLRTRRRRITPPLPPHPHPRHKGPQTRKPEKPPPARLQPLPPLPGGLSGGLKPLASRGIGGGLGAINRQEPEGRSVGGRALPDADSLLGAHISRAPTPRSLAPSAAPSQVMSSGPNRLWTATAGYGPHNYGPHNLGQRLPTPRDAADAVRTAIPRLPSLNQVTSMTHIRQSRPGFDTHKTVKTRF